MYWKNRWSRWDDAAATRTISVAREPQALRAIPVSTACSQPSAVRWTGVDADEAHVVAAMVASAFHRGAIGWQQAESLRRGYNTRTMTVAQIRAITGTVA